MLLRQKNEFAILGASLAEAQGVVLALYVDVCIGLRHAVFPA